ncbi:MAG: iron-siderophore ABC transporter substrate-binding protein [Cyanobacteria bacterium J06626_4]
MSDRTFISHRMTRLLRQMLWVVLAFILVTACRADHSQVSPDASQTAPAAPVRLVQHLMGETQVPVNPQRVVTLDANYLSNALVLGIQPIGSTAWSDAIRRSGLDPVEPYLRDRAQELTIVGYGQEVNVETVLLLKPDLILGNDTHAAIYEQLAQIAPTALFTYYDGSRNWKDVLRFSASVLGKSQAAEKLLDDYEQRTQELRQKLDDRASMIQVSVITPGTNGARLMYRNSLSGGVLEDVGLSRPPAQDQEGTNAFVSFELIPHMDGDVIFVISHMDDDGLDVVNQLKNQPLWSQLAAVKQGKVYPVDAQHWYGTDIVRVNLILDDLFKYLLEEE